MGTYWGRAGYYFGFEFIILLLFKRFLIGYAVLFHLSLALICFGLAGDLGIATAALLLLNAAGHIGLGFMARRQSSVY
jgi:hypothetical protein